MSSIFADINFEKSRAEEVIGPFIGSDHPMVCIRSGVPWRATTNQGRNKPMLNFEVDERSSALCRPAPRLIYIETGCTT
jgi:hypothetical protein